MRAAVRLAPEWGAEIAAAAAGAFPAFAPEITAAAAGKVPPAKVSGAVRQAAPGAEAPPAAVAKAAAPETEPESKWSGHVELGATRTTGNTEQASFNTAAEVINERRRWRHKFEASFDFDSENEETIQNRIVASANSAYKITKRLRVFGFFEYEDDEFSGFDYRLSENVGLGYLFVDIERWTFDIEAGPGARQSKIEATGDVDSEATARLNESITWKISPSAKFLHDTTFVVGTDRTTIETDNALKLNITNPLSAKISFELRHDTDVPADTEKTDTTTKISLVYDF